MSIQAEVPDIVWSFSTPEHLNVTTLLPEYGNEALPNGGRTNMGIYGNASEASKALTSASAVYYVEPGAYVVAGAHVRHP